jgi:hypothetical protein
MVDAWRPPASSITALPSSAGVSCSRASSPHAARQKVFCIASCMA